MARNQITMSLSGDKEINKSFYHLLERLPEKIQHKPLVAGARIIAKAAKRSALFQDQSGDLRASVRAARKKVGYGRGKNRKQYYIALARAGKYGRFMAGASRPYAHLVEFGHAGPHAAPPHPFMAEAAREKFDAVWSAVSRGILQEFARLNLK